MLTARPPIPIVRAEGAYLYTAEGMRYFDGTSSWWVNLHGHTHPHIVSAIQSQVATLEQISFADFTHAPAEKLAARLLPLLPGAMSKIFYSDNGSTAVETALKMALQYWHNLNKPKTKIVCFNHSYHGDTFGAMSSAGRNAFNRPFWKHLFDVTSIDPPVKGDEERTLAQLKNVLEAGDVACFIFEPLVLGTGGMKVYSRESLHAVLRCCQRYDVLTIADEVMTGFGRTGSLFACDGMDLGPDILCLSKGITGGFLPLGVTACKQGIFDAFLGDHLSTAFLHGHSYTGNPLACVSALASLDLLLDTHCTRQRAMIAQSHGQFCQQWTHHPKLLRCESVGTVLILEYQVDQSSYFQPIRDVLYQFFLERGMLLRPLGNVLYLMPPYCVTQKELHWIYETIAETLHNEQENA